MQQRMASLGGANRKPFSSSLSDVLDNFCLANIKCVKPQCMSTSVLSYSSPLNSNLKEVDLKGFHSGLVKTFLELDLLS